MPKVAIESRKQAAKRPRPPLPNRTVGIYKNVVGTKKFRLQFINVGQLFFNQKKDLENQKFAIFSLLP